MQAFPVVRPALCNAESGVIFKVAGGLFPTQEARIQIVFLMFQYGVGNAVGVVMCFDLVVAQAGYPFLVFVTLPCGFGKHTPLLEALVWHERFVAVTVAAAFHTRNVHVIQIIYACLQIDRIPVEGGFQTACIGVAFGVVGVFNLHAVLADGAQAVGIHNVVDFALTVTQFEFAEPRRDAALAEADVPSVAVEFTAVHHTVGVGDFRAAAFVCAGDGGVFGRSDADLQHLAVALEVGMNVVAGTVFIVVRFVVRNIGADVSVFAAEFRFERTVAAAVAADCGGRVYIVRFFSKIRIFADKLNGTAHQAHALRNGLRAFGYNHFVKTVGMDVRGRRIHTHTAAAVNKLVVRIDGQTRTAQTAEQRIARAAAFADDAHIGHGLKQVRTITGRHGLNGGFRVEFDRIGLLLLRAGNDHGRKCGILFDRFVGCPNLG